MKNRIKFLLQYYYYTVVILNEEERRRLQLELAHDGGPSLREAPRHGPRRFRLRGKETMAGSRENLGVFRIP